MAGNWGNNGAVYLDNKENTKSYLLYYLVGLGFRFSNRNPSYCRAFQFISYLQTNSSEQRAGD